MTDKTAATLTFLNARTAAGTLILLNLNPADYVPGPNSADTQILRLSAGPALSDVPDALLLREVSQMWPRALDHMLRCMLLKGSLEATLPDGQCHTYGDGVGARQRVHIHDLAAVRHLVLNPEMALAEAYMSGTLTIEAGDLQGFWA